MKEYNNKSQNNFGLLGSWESKLWYTLYHIKSAKLALSASWTDELIAESLRASERNSVVLGSDPTQANFLKLLLKILQWWIQYKICVSLSYIKLYKQQRKMQIQRGIKYKEASILVTQNLEKPGYDSIWNKKNFG